MKTKKEAFRLDPDPTAAPSKSPSHRLQQRTQQFLFGNGASAATSTAALCRSGKLEPEVDRTQATTDHAHQFLAS